MDVTAMGEVLIDLTQTGKNNIGIPMFAANPGGAPANICVAISRLGGKSAFMGKIGNDGFGSYLKNTLQENGVDVSGLCTGEKATTMAIVSVDADGERDFRFIRGADGEFSLKDINMETVKQSKFFHFGSISLTTEAAYEATLFAIKAAREFNILTSYDPNYRAVLWSDESEAAERMKIPLPFVDIIKLSEEELPLLTGTTDLKKGSDILQATGVSLILITLGDKGAFYRLGKHIGHVEGVKTVIVDTNGAGDTFFGAVLYQLCQRNKETILQLTVPEIENIITFANRVAAKTCSRSGAIPAMPFADELR